MTSVNLGELRAGQPDCPSDLALDSLAVNEASPEEAGSWRTHIAGCTHCQGRMAMRRQGFEAFPELDAKQPLLALHAFREVSQRPRLHERLLAGLRGPRWAFLTAGVAAAAVLTIVLLRDRAPDPIDDPTQEPQEVRIKGAFAMHVFRQRSEGAEEMVSGDRFRPGDNLRFVVDLPRPGHISIIGVDTQGNKYIAWPLPQHVAEQKADTQRQAGKHQELPGSVTLDDSNGEESLYLVLCPTVAELAQCHRDAKSTKLGCPAGCSTFSFKLGKAP
jgi:hypothetical protein